MLTRAVVGEKLAGRLKVLLAIRSAVAEVSPGFGETVLRPLVETRSLRRGLGAILAYVREAAAGRLLPLQCLLYADPVELDRACDALGPAATAVYLDGVRCYLLLERLRRRRPNLRIVVDFDDLMSRRMALLLSADQLPSPGYLSGSMPGVVTALLSARVFARWLLKYERAALALVEGRIKRLADDVVLLSSADARALADRHGAEKIIVIPPSVQIRRPAAPLKPGQIRFVFIGADRLRQNQLTIDRLLALWSEIQTTTSLVVFGEQTRQYALPANVQLAGYVDSIEDVYDGGSVLLTPSYIAGGIKTKVLEAFAYGAPVVGNAATFESMDIGDYPLLMSDESELAAMLRDPEPFRDRFDHAARVGAAYIARRHDPERFARSWREVMGLGADG